MGMFKVGDFAYLATDSSNPVFVVTDVKTTILYAYHGQNQTSYGVKETVDLVGLSGARKDRVYKSIDPCSFLPYHTKLE